MKKTYRLWTMVLAALVALALAAPALAQSGDAMVRVAHLASDAPNVDVYVDDAPVPELQNVAYGTISPYLPLPAGAYNIKVYATGDYSAPVIEADVEVAGGAAYTIGAVGLVGDGSLAAQVYEDDLAAPASGNAKVRVIHASPDAGPVDVVPEGGEALVSGLEFPSASPYAEVPAGSYVLNVNAAGTDQTAITTEATVADGGIYTAFAVGTAAAGDLGVLIAQDNASGVMPDTGGTSPALLVGAAAGLFLATAAAAYAVRRRLAFSRTR